MSSAPPASPPSLDHIYRSTSLALSDLLINPVYESGANHAEVLSRELSTQEKFYVNVAKAYIQQERNKTILEQHNATNKATTPIMPLPTVEKIERLVNMSRYQVDNFTSVIEQIIKKQSFTTNEQSNRHLAAASESAASEESKKPLSDELDVITKNRCAVLLQLKKQQLKSAQSILSAGIATLQQTAQVNSNHFNEIKQLSKYWLIKHKQSPGNLLPALSVDYRIANLGQEIAGKSQILLQRNEQGQVFVDKNFLPDNINNPFSQLDEWPMKEEKKRDDQAQVGWSHVAAKLHTAQNLLLYKQLYTQLMTEAREFTALNLHNAATSSNSKSHSPFFYCAILHDTIIINSSGFKSLTLHFPQGPSAAFLIDCIDAHDNSVLVSACLNQLFQHYQSTAEYNRPSLLHTQHNKSSTANLLQFLVTYIYHMQILQQFATILQQFQSSLNPFQLQVNTTPTSLPHSLDNIYHSYVIRIQGKFRVQANVRGIHIELLSQPADSTLFPRRVSCSNIEHFKQLFKAALA
jgi:hypothetical protein